MSSMGMLRETTREIPVLHPGIDTPANRIPRILARSTAMCRVVEQMERAIPHLRVAAIEGEGGTGKSLVAEQLHALGPACEGPLLVLPAAIFDSARVPSTGGMLLLDRLEEMPQNRQAMLLHFLRCRDSFTLDAAFTPLQIVVSSNRPIRSLVAAGSLLPDLAYRLTAVRFHLPPLRERHEDIPALAKLFLDRYSRKYRKSVEGLGSGSLARLFAHSWPGNVRELESVIESACLEAEGQWIRPLDLCFTPVAVARPQNNPAPLDLENLSLDAATRHHIAGVMSYTGGNKKRAAQLLRISRSTLYRLLDQP